MSKTHGDGGKGSGRRQEDVSKINENWDRIFGKKKEAPMIEDDDDYIENDHDEQHDDSDWSCVMCGGPMYRQAHWNYTQCDDCGARQELIDDDYL
jgi:hypothetical protein